MIEPITILAKEIDAKMFLLIAQIRGLKFEEV